MFELFPILAGVLMGVFVPRLIASTQQRRGIYALLGIAVAATATILASEEWFFIFVDLAEVFLALAVTSLVIGYLSQRTTTAR